MSVSDEQRREERRAVLVRMLEVLGDQDVSSVAVSPTDPEFADILPTTWRELLDDNLIDDKWSAMGSPHFRLTTHGWLRALALSGALDDTGLRKRCTGLAQALKAVVKGRHSHHDGIVHISNLVETTGLPMGWICNAIRARLLGVVFKNDRWDVQYDKRMVRISPTLGLNHLEDEA